MSIELLASDLARMALKAFWRELPLWAKVLVAIAISLISILLIGIILVVIWIAYSFISSGDWKSLPPQVAASIVAGLFTVITLLLSGSVNKEREIKSALRLKEIESREISLTTQTELYIELIDNLIALDKDYKQVDKLFDNLYGRLYVQASPKITSKFFSVLNTIKEDKSNTQSTSDVQIKIDRLISDIRSQLMRDRSEIAALYRPSSLRA